MARTLTAPVARFDQDALRADVRAYLTRQQATAVWLASEAGWSVSGMYQWLRGLHDCGADGVASIAHAVDLSLDAYVRPTG